MMEQRLLWNAARLLSRQSEMEGSFKGLRPVYSLFQLDHSRHDRQDAWIHNVAKAMEEIQLSDAFTYVLSMGQ
jgi:hypothetical protein